MLFEASTAEDIETSDCGRASIAHLPSKSRAGNLVLIAPTDRVDGSAMPAEEIPHMSPMYVEWVPEGGESALLASLQNGNPQTLAIYARAPMAVSDVQRIKALLEQDRIRDEWFSVWRPLIGLVEILSGTAAEQRAVA